MLLHSNPSQICKQSSDIDNQALVTAAHIMPVTVATTQDSLQGALTFSRSMYLKVPLIADWQMIAQHSE